ncbi:MAG: hypothetical protein M3O29_07325, partial [Actinomycetota bacterium]|nr:hypothetical protein [Actinomycetota bacterium]
MRGSLARSARAAALGTITAVALMLAVGGTAWAASPGHRLWARIYDGPANGPDGPTAIAVSPDSSDVYVTGSSSSNLVGQDAVTIAFDPDGGTMWRARYDGPAHYEDGGADIGVSPDSSAVYVTGSSSSNLVGQDAVTIAFDPDGGT